MQKNNSLSARLRAILLTALPPSPWSCELRDSRGKSGPVRESALSLLAVLACLFLEGFLGFVYLLFLISARLPSFLEKLFAAEGGWFLSIVPLVRQEFASALASNRYELFTLTSSSLAICGAIFYWRVLRRRSYSSLGLPSEGVAREYFLGALMGALMLGSVLLLGLSLRLVSFDPDPSASIPLQRLFPFVVGHALYGFSQQLLYRGVVLSSFARYRSLTASVLLSAVVYALFHAGRAGITPIALINLFLFGILTAVFALRRGSIWGAAALHTAWNLMQSNIFGISQPDSLGTDSLFHLILSAERPLLAGGAYGLEGGLLVSFALVLFIILICVIPTARVHSAKDTCENKKG